MKTITFYSYKGGVGRSLALANVATRLAEFKKKVCLLDFDLEAPGLQYKFPNFTHNHIHKGIVDYIHSFTHSGVLPTNISDFIIKFSIDSSKNVIDFIPAGNVESRDYWKKLSSINWNELLYENDNGLAFLFDLKEKIKREVNPDFLLIDSRTGISEMSGITLSLFADEVVIVAANNQENLQGCKKIINAISNSENILNEKAPRIVFVLSRIPFTDNPDDKAREQTLIQKIKKSVLFPHLSELSVIHSDRELEEIEQIKIGYKKDDGTAQISRDYLNLFEELTKEDLSGQEIRIFRDIKEAERLYVKAVEEKFPIQKLELINQALELNPSSLEYNFYKSYILYNQFKKDDAKSILQKIIDKNEKHKQSYILLSNILVEQKLYDAAIVQYDRMLKIFGDDFSIFYGYGLAYSRKGELEKGIEYYSKAIEINPNIAIAYNNRANAYFLINHYEDALKDVYKALELNSELAVAYFTLAEIHAKLNHTNDFYFSLELALKFDKNGLAEKLISENKVYKEFFKQERFMKILEKYNISVPATLLENTKG